MPAPLAPALPNDVAHPTGFLHTLLSTALVAVAVLRPLYEEDAETIRDFAWVYLNPAGQQMLHQPGCPTASLLTLFPAAQTDGVFAKCCQAFRTSETQRNQTLYQADGLDGYFLLVAQRYEDLLVVNFTDTNDRPRSAAEEALRQSQAREQQARAEAEAGHQQFYQVLQQLPAQIATYQGPDLRYSFVNSAYQRYFPRQVQLLGRPLRQVLPEAAEQGVIALMDRVYQTGEPHYSPETEVWLDFTGTAAPRQQVFLNLLLHPLRDAQGRVNGLLDFSYDVTEQVLARRQVQRLNEELAAINQELQAANAEYQASNGALATARQQLEQLNHALEAGVRERTAQLAEQQDLLRQILSQLPAFVATLSGPAHRFTFANALYQQLVAGRATLGTPVAEALPEVVEQGFIPLLDRVYASGQPYVGREIAIMLQPPGEATRQHYLDFTYQPLTNGQGLVQGILVFAVDVTEQVRTRRQADTLQAAMLAATRRRAHEREELYQVFEQAPAAVALLREPDHRIEYVNPAYAQFFPGLALPGRLLTQVHPDIATNGTLARLDQVFATGVPYVGEAQPVALALGPGPELETRYFNFTYQPYREQERTVGVSIFAYDVTEQTLARQQQARQQQWLQRIFEQAPVAIFVLRGPAYVLEVVNTAMSELLGYPAAALLGRPYFEAVPELATQGYPELLTQVWQTGQPVAVQESPAHLARHQPGETGYFTFVYQPLFDADDTLTSIMCVAVDVTEQVLARRQVQQLNHELTATNQELHATNAQLQRTNTDLDTFVYTASHDLKAPIANIEGLLTVLRQYLPPASQEPMVERVVGMMQGAIARFQRTVGHLTDVSRLPDQFDQPTEDLDLARVIEDVRLDLLPLFESTQARLVVQVQDCPRVRASAKSLRSIVYNLLSNAVKYRDAARPPVVQVRARCHGPHTQLEVQDNGLGLSEQQQGDLFKMFKRLHTQVEGSGVGLYMIKRLIENANGTITVQSQPGVGSTFTVRLPRA